MFLQYICSKKICFKVDEIEREIKRNEEIKRNNTKHLLRCKSFSLNHDFLVKCKLLTLDYNSLFFFLSQKVPLMHMYARSYVIR